MINKLIQSRAEEFEKKAPGFTMGRDMARTGAEGGKMPEKSKIVFDYDTFKPFLESSLKQLTKEIVESVPCERAELEGKIETGWNNHCKLVQDWKDSFK